VFARPGKFSDLSTGRGRSGHEVLLLKRMSAPPRPTMAESHGSVPSGPQVAICQWKSRCSVRPWNGTPARATPTCHPRLVLEIDHEARGPPTFHCAKRTNAWIGCAWVSNRTPFRDAVQLPPIHTIDRVADPLPNGWRKQGVPVLIDTERR
jgi:hypothetical protein